MLKSLIKLANYLDERNKKYEANIIDVFLNKIAQVDPGEQLEENFNDTPRLSDPTWHTSSTMASEEGELPKDVSDFMLEIDNKKQLHPLIQIIDHCLKKIFTQIDTGVVEDVKTGISSEDIKNFLEIAFRYQDDLTVNKSLNNNPNPIAPNTMKSLLFQEMKSFIKTYQNKGSLDGFLIKDMILALYQNYEDAYLDRYMEGNLSGEQLYLTPGDAPDFKNPRLLGLQKGDELTPVQREKLWRMNDKQLSTNDTQAWVDYGQNVDSETAKKNKELDKRKIRQEYPEDWHQVLLDD